MDEEVVLKLFVTESGAARRTRVSKADLNLEVLARMLESTKSHVFHWVDQDDDQIEIRNNEDLHEAVAATPCDHCVKVYATLATTHTPTLFPCASPDGSESLQPSSGIHVVWGKRAFATRDLFAAVRDSAVAQTVLQDVRRCRRFVRHTLAHRPAWTRALQYAFPMLLALTFVWPTATSLGLIAIGCGMFPASVFAPRAALFKVFLGLLVVRLSIGFLFELCTSPIALVIIAYSAFKCLGQAQVRMVWQWCCKYAQPIVQAQQHRGEAQQHRGEEEPPQLQKLQQLQVMFPTKSGYELLQCLKRHNMVADEAANELLLSCEGI